MRVGVEPAAQQRAANSPLGICFHILFGSLCLLKRAYICIYCFGLRKSDSSSTCPVAGGLKRLAYSLLFDSRLFRACLARLRGSSEKVQTGFLIHVEQPSLKRDGTENATLIGSTRKHSVSPLLIGRRTCEAALPYFASWHLFLFFQSTSLRCRARTGSGATLHARALTGNHGLCCRLTTGSGPGRRGAPQRVTVCVAYNTVSPTRIASSFRSIVSWC